MIEEIHPDVFLLKIPLPNSALRHLNAYVIRTGGRPLIVDTGFPDLVCLEAMQSGLKKLDIDLNTVDFFITHMHPDHLGLVAKIASRKNKIYFNRIEAEVLRTRQGWESLNGFAVSYGYPDKEIATAIDKLPRHRIIEDVFALLTLLDDGDGIQVGNYQFQCIQTPGHSPGHLCLYEPAQKIFFAGDHLLADISPSLQCWVEVCNPLNNYLASLDRVNALDIDLVLPGHRKLIHDHRARISEIKTHHGDRCREILEKLEDGPLNGYQIASRMSWDVPYDAWESYPPVQKWFAFGEAMAHLKHLERAGQIIRLAQNGGFLFSLCGK